MSTLEPNVDGELVVELNMSCKWGFDGYTGQSQYKKRFSDAELSCDRSLFSTFLVALDLNDGNKSIWRNPVPSSTRFCRLIRISYAKESIELSQLERDDIENQIKNLNKSVIVLMRNGLSVEVRVKYY
jgi:hypothetical protein